MKVLNNSGDSIHRLDLLFAAGWYVDWNNYSLYFTDMMASAVFVSFEYCDSFDVFMPLSVLISGCFPYSSRDFRHYYGFGLCLFSALNVCLAWLICSFVVLALQNNIPFWSFCWYLSTVFLINCLCVSFRSLASLSRVVYREVFWRNTTTTTIEPSLSHWGNCVSFLSFLFRFRSRMISNGIFARWWRRIRCTLEHSWTLGVGWGISGIE